MKTPELNCKKNEMVGFLQSQENITEQQIDDIMLLAFGMVRGITVDIQNNVNVGIESIKGSNELYPLTPKRKK